MSIHKWRKRPTKHFGDTWVPFAQVDIQGTDGKNHNIVLQIDSGAVVSLLRRSVASLLGLELERGRQVELSSVGGSKSVAYIHELFMRLDPHITLRVPFAFAETERVPNLLGRFGVFDTVQINFDATFTETKIAAPWLAPDERRIWDFVMETEQFILKRWPELPLAKETKEALRRLLQRGGQLFATVAGLLQLHRAFDAPLIIRALFEHAAQTIFLMKNPDERASNYLDYQHVTRHLYSQRTVKNPAGPLAELLANSPLRKDGEARNLKEFERVKGKYLRKNGEVWDRWYCMSLFDLARSIGWEGEYRFWYAIGSGWSHADPFFAQRTSGFEGYEKDATFNLCYIYYGRMLHAISRSLILTHEQVRFFEEVSKPFC